jgi:hypothetical protein
VCTSDRLSQFSSLPNRLHVLSFHVTSFFTPAVRMYRAPLLFALCSCFSSFVKYRLLSIKRHFWNDDEEKSVNIRNNNPLISMHTYNDSHKAGVYHQMKLRYRSPFFCYLSSFSSESFCFFSHSITQFSNAAFGPTQNSAHPLHLSNSSREY